MSDKSSALQQISTLAQQSELTAKEIYDYLTHETPQERESLVTRVLAYLGAVFLLGGISAYAAMFWPEMSSIVRVVITLGLGFILYVTAVISDVTKHLPKLTTPLHIIAFLLQITGLFVFLAEYFESTNRWQEPVLFVFGTLAIQQYLTFLALKRTTLLFHTLFCLSLCLLAILDIVYLDISLSFTVVGTLLIVASYYLDKTDYYAITPFWYFVGSLTALTALFDFLLDNKLDIIFLLPSCFLVYLSTVVYSRTLLFVSVLSIFCFLAYFTGTYFSDSIGWPLSLIIIGFLLFGLSSIGYKISRKIKSK